MAGCAEANRGREADLDRQLARAEEDLGDLLSGLRIPVLFLGRDLTIRRFTPETRWIAAIRPEDVGRSIRDLRLRIDSRQFEQNVLEAIAGGSVKRFRVRDHAGRQWVVRLRPSREGAIVAFFPRGKKRARSDAREAPAVPEALAELDLNGLALAVETAVRPCLPDNIKMYLSLSSRLDPFRAQRSKLETALSGFLSAAVRELRDGGQVRIETRFAAASERGGFQCRCVQLCLRIARAGAGWSSEMPPLLAAVSESGGFSMVEVNAATVVSLFFPCAPLTAAGLETVLVADDDIAVRSLVARLLRNKGYTVLEAASGQEALRVAKSHAGRIDLLVTDVRMPYMSGRELADRLQPLHPELRTIYMSGYAEEDIEAHGVFEPGVVLIRKPFTRDALANKVREVLGRTGDLK